MKFTKLSNIASSFGYLCWIAAWELRVGGQDPSSAHTTPKLPLYNKDLVHYQFVSIKIYILCAILKLLVYYIVAKLYYIYYMCKISNSYYMVRSNWD